MKEKEKAPYRSPEITKVVFRKEQAVLSHCSVAPGTGASSGAGPYCYAASCAKTSVQFTEDSGDNS